MTDVEEAVALYLVHRRKGVKLDAPYPSLPPDAIELWDRNTARGVLEIIGKAVADHPSNDPGYQYAVEKKGEMAAALREIRSIADQAEIYATGKRPMLDPAKRFAMIADLARPFSEVAAQPLATDGKAHDAT